MSTASLSLLKGVIIMMALILLAYYLKRTGFLKKEQSGLFSQLVLKITLPALILSSLIQHQFHLDFIKMAGWMAVIEIFIMILAFLIARAFRFSRSQTGAFILVSTFGMTTMLGYPLIAQMFPDNALAMEEAVITSEFGVGFLLFIFGPLIAMYFGQNNLEISNLKKSLKSFLFSPIFISLVFGLILSTISFPKDNIIYNGVLSFLGYIAQANLLLVAFTIGLILEIKSMEKVYLFVGLVLLLKLIIKPLLSVWITKEQGFSDMMEQIVFIETAMPSAILTAVFAKQYHCKPELVSVCIMISLIVSVISLPLMFAYFY